jgi:hypothetical protein
MFVMKLGGSQDGKLLSLFANATSDELVLRVMVLFSVDGNKYRREGHRYSGSTWVRYEREEFIELSTQQLDEAMAAAGWSMSGRPVKQPSLYMNYFFSRGRDGYATVDMVNDRAHERSLQEKRFEEIEGVMGNHPAFAALPVHIQDGIKKEMTHAN